MAVKTLNTRIQNKHDTTTNWAKATNFVPLNGELIVYDDVHKIKIGDGVTTVVNLPFIVGEGGGAATYVEYATKSAMPVPGTAGILCLVQDTNLLFRWNTTTSNYDDVPDTTGKADKVASATNGHLAGLDSTGNLTDSGYSVDTTPTSSSSNLITSGGVYTSLGDKQNTITANGVLQGDGAGTITARGVDATVTASSANLITSGAVDSAINTYNYGNSYVFRFNTTSDIEECFTDAEMDSILMTWIGATTEYSYTEIPSGTATITLYNGRLYKIQGEVDASSNLKMKITWLAETLPSVTSSDNGAIERVVDGVWTKQTVDTTPTASSNNLITSGAVATFDSRITTNTDNISTINGKIPSEATTSNQLADKTFVNSSVATNTANFLGTSEAGLTQEQFLTWANALPNKTNNDYCFWNTVDSDGNTVYKRYKYNSSTTTWNFEYELNNSSFTAAQWSTINSGMAASDKTKLNGIEEGANNYSLPVASTSLGGVKSGGDITVGSDGSVSVNGKQSTITANGVLQGDGAGNITAKTVDSTVTASSTNLITSGAVNSAITTFQYEYNQDLRLSNTSEIAEMIEDNGIVSFVMIWIGSNTTYAYVSHSGSSSIDLYNGRVYKVEGDLSSGSLKLEINLLEETLQTVTSSDNGSIERVLNGVWTKDTVDSAPSTNSTHLVTSGGVASGLATLMTEINAKQSTITANGVLQGNGSGTITAKTVDTTATSDSSNLITSGAVYTAANGKQDKITANGLLQGDGAGNISAASTTTPTLKSIDSTATSGSTNLITSGAVYTAVSDKQSQHLTTTATLAAASWSSSTITVNVSGVTASNTIIVSPAPASVNDWASAKVYCSAQGVGTLTFTCTTTPSSNLTANIVILN